MNEPKRERRPSWERRAIREIKEELGIKHTEAIRVFEDRKRKGS